MLRCFRKILGISYKGRVTNEHVRKTIIKHIGPYEDLLATVKRRKLKWYEHVARSDGLTKVILQETVEGRRRRGRPKKSWIDNIVEWAGDSSHGTQPAGVERADEDVRHDAPLWLLAELRDQGKAYIIYDIYIVHGFKSNKL